MKKRVFKLKTFARWAKKVLPDERLCEAAQEILNGHYEADLGAGLCKKRIAMPGQGKSGATRTLVAKEGAHGIFFIAGRQKSDPRMRTSLRPRSSARPCKRPALEN